MSNFGIEHLLFAQPRPVGFTMFHFFLFKHAILSECVAALAWTSAQGAGTEQNRTEDLNLTHTPVEEMDWNSDRILLSELEMSSRQV